MDGETEALTLNLRSVGSVNHRIPQTLKVTVLLDERTASDSFNFFVRNADDALLGLGSRDGKVVTISGSGNADTQRGYFSTHQVRDHLEDEGFVYEHQAVDQEKLKKECERANKIKKKHANQYGEYERDKWGDYLRDENGQRKPRKPAVVDGLTETSCFMTVASRLGLTVSNFHELTVEDYLDLKNFEGCLKTVEGFCPTCGDFFNLIYYVGYEIDRVQAENLQNLFGKLFPQCGSGGGIELCPPNLKSGNQFRPESTLDYSGRQQTKIQSTLDYWNRHRNNYLPSCQLMLDRTSSPWRLSGICSHPTGHSHSVSFEATPTSDFMLKEEYPNKEDSYHYYEGHQQNNQHNYYSETNVFPDSFINLRKLKVYVGFGVMLLIFFFVFTRKLRGNSEEKCK
ncbi:hypothetical protein TrVE_jg9796 [Triparma verrucosa]|uniref:Uncharacterized protein n=1 Tax=Triparma verrucosa TaxID=1606542 RepID=A0A9W7B7P8_9STRA|nr:hypothetical protein TrVE_jg9796 [Triparma verrucosa]